MSASAYAGSYIYTGTWTNWAKGRIQGATLTVHPREAGLLASFLAIYVSFVGGQFWKILCYTTHLVRAGKPGTKVNDFHRHSQVILRNSAGAASAFWEFSRLMCGREDRTRKQSLQCLAFALLALLNLSGFGIAGIFSSEVTKTAGNTTLLYSPNCGYTQYPDGFDPTLSKLLNTMRIAESAAGYARACYGAAENPLQCNTYPQSQLAFRTDRNVSCPFKSTRCLRNLSVSFDTGHMDTFGEFGDNAPKNERVTYRRVTTCAPLDLKDLTRIESHVDPNLGALEEVESIYAGPTNFGFAPYNLTAPTYSRNLRSAVAGNGYGLESAFSAVATNWSYWEPVSDLNRTDADVTIVFISFNNIEFVDQNDDPIFSAHIPSISSSLGVPVWKPDNNISALACAEQHQFCNPNIAEGSPDRCTDLTASELLWGQNHVEDTQLLKDNRLTRLSNTSIHLNPFQEIIAGYSSATLSAGMYFSLFSRAASALKASETVYQYVQSALPNDQWITELSGWFSVGLATIQQSALNYALGPIHQGGSGVLVRPAANDTLGRRLCKSQTIRNSGQVQSFSILGMSLILALGGLIIVVSYTMESVVCRLQQYLRRGEHRRAEWERDEKLQLLAHGARENGDGNTGVAHQGTSPHAND